MAANTTPIYSKLGQIGLGSTLTTANTATDGTGTVAVIFTAGTDGARVERLRVKPRGTNTTTVLRIFINNGSDNNVAANNSLYAEKTISATSLTQTSAMATSELPDTTDSTAFPLVLPPNYRLLATIGTTVAAGLDVSVVGGTY